MRRYAYVTWAVAWRQVHNVIRNPALVVPAVVFPLFFFTAFAGGLSAVANVPAFDYPDYEAFQFVFVLLQSAAMGGVFSAWGIAADFESGLARRLMLATPRRSALIVGYAGSALVRAAVTWVILTGVALAAGMQVGGEGLDLVGLYGLAVVVNLAATGFGAGLALRTQTLQAGPLMNIPVFLALFMAPVYVPRELLEGWIATVADFNPVTPILEAGRQLIAGQLADVGLAFLTAGALVLALAVFALRGMRRAEKRG